MLERYASHSEAMITWFEIYIMPVFTNAYDVVTKLPFTHPLIAGVFGFTAFILAYMIRSLRVELREEIVPQAKPVESINPETHPSHASYWTPGRNI